MVDVAKLFLSTPSARRATQAHRGAPLWTQNFYPRPPRGGRRVHAGVGCVIVRFLSTPSARRATRWLRMCVGASTFLSTPSARRATKPEWAKSLKGIISIHALREEGDHPPTKPKEARHDFYPRPPRGGRLEVSARVPPPNRFLSTPSARRATLDNGFVSAAELFLSTPSARRATRMPRPPAADLRISIHALREEGDPSAPTAWAT